jgi:hypothetical protein
MFDEGTDDSPVELDGLGGNAGISTPYLPFGGNPPQQYPEHQQMDDESVMRINGQDVRATLDGVGIPFAFALHLLQNGSALPAALDRYQHLQGFRFESNGVGTFSVNIPGYRFYNTTSGGGSGTDSDPIRVGSYTDYPAQNFSFSFGAALSVQTKQVENKTETTRKQELKKLLRNNKDCEKALKKLGLDIKKEFKNKNFLDVREGSDVANSTLRELGMDLSNAPKGFNADAKIGETKNAYAQNVSGTNKILIFQSFYRQSTGERGLTIIHEIMHEFFKEGSHVDLARKLGFNIQHDYKDFDFSTPELKDFKGNVIQAGEKKILTFDVNEQRAIDAINGWIRIYCSK